MKKNKKKTKNKKNRTIYEKYFIIAGLIIVVAAFIVFIIKNTDNHILKSEYGMNEQGYLDKIEVTLKKANYINNETGIEITFEITNRTPNTITIIADDYFKFYDINQVQIPNKYNNNSKIVKKDETIIYKLQYDVTKKELYEVYFYSQTVENNIKFSFNSNDMTPEPITENNMDEEIEMEDIN